MPRPIPQTLPVVVGLLFGAPSCTSAPASSIDANTAQTSPDADAPADRPVTAVDAQAARDVPAASDAGVAIAYRRDQIELVSRDNTRGADGVSYRRTFYRNRAYRCGRTGFYTFALLEPVEVVDRPAPLWVVLHGGGTGYYGTDGRYHPGTLRAGAWVGANEDQNDEYDLTQLSPWALRYGRPGMRRLALHMCDHDLYGGVGDPYLNNPNPGRADDRAEGLLASAAAVHFVARGNGLAGSQALAGHPTTLVFFQGSSAGSAGAYFVSAGLARLGVRINGAVMDSYVITSRHPDLFASRCTPLNRDATFDPNELVRRIGPFMRDPSLLLERNVPGPYAIPYLALQGTADPHCCGPSPVVPQAQAAGFTNNCRYVYDVVSTAFARSGDPLQRVVLIPEGGHVALGVANSPTGRAAQAAVDEWFAAVMATNPTPPTFPD